MKRDRRWTTFAEGGCGIRCGEEAGGFREDVRGAAWGEEGRSWLIFDGFP